MKAPPEPLNLSLRNATACVGLFTLLVFVQNSSAIEAEGLKLEETSEVSGLLSDLEWTVGVNFGISESDGSESAKLARTDTLDQEFGGLERLEFKGPIGENWWIDSAFRAIAGRDEYKAELNLNHFDGAFLHLDYRQFRIYDEAAGGYLPISNSFFTIDPDEDLYLDRQFLSLKIGHVELPFGEVYGLYRYMGRDGTRQSTIWGLSEFAQTKRDRGTVPTLLELGEERHFFEIGLQAALSESIALNAKLFVEDSQLKNTTLIDNSEARKASRITHDEQQDAKALGGYATLRYRLNEQLTTNTAWSFTKMDFSSVGSRIYADDYYLPYDPEFRNYPHRQNASFRDLVSHSDWEQTTFQFSAIYTPTKRLSLVPSFRIESVQQDSETSFEGLQHRYQENYKGASGDDFDRLESEIELRYRPKNWIHMNTQFYWAEEDGDLRENLLSLGTDSNVLDFANSYRRQTKRFAAGMNLKPSSRFVIRIKGSYQEQRNEYGHPTRDLRSGDSFITSARFYPGHIREHKIETHSIHASVTWRASKALTSKTRAEKRWVPIGALAYSDYTGLQSGEIIESDTENWILSQSFTWSPKPWFTGLLQGSYVQSHARSKSDSLVLDSPSFSQPDGLNEEVVEANYDYITVSADANISLGENSAIQCSYRYLYADNFVDNSSDSVPYQVSQREHTVSAIYTRRMKKGVLWKLGLTAWDRDEASKGGYSDFTSLTLASSLEFKF